MTKKLPELSFFTPAYNEEAVIEQTLTKVNSILPQIARKYEIIVINDGSTDNTAGIVARLMKTNPNLRMITHDPNRGYGAALKSGLYGAKYKYATYIDADGQFDFAEIKSFLPYIDEYDLVIGYRARRADRGLRKLIAFLLKIWNLVWFQFSLRDADCAMKLWKKEVIDTIPPLQTESAITETEWLIKAKQAGFKFKEIPVSHHPRLAGQSTGGNFKVILKAAWETFKLWWILKVKKQ